MKIGLTYKTKEKILAERMEQGVPFLVFPLLEDTGMVKHGFSTRLGGVSEGCLSTMNLSFSRGDREEAVRENFSRMARAIGVKDDSFVFSHQTHTTNVRVVTKDDCGKGLNRPLDYENVDGLITNESGVCLTTFYADCVPLFFLDPKKKVIGLSHSGWRGTVNKIGKITVDKMCEIYGCEPKNILVAIGPSICQNCYEVSEDVICIFKEKFDSEYWCDLFYKKENGKYHLNLWRANEILLDEAGIQREHIVTTNVCTCCNHKLLFSHRASEGKRGNLAAFLSLK